MAERHRFDPGSLLGGIYYLAVAGIFIASGLSGNSIVPVIYLGPALLIGFALVLLVRLLSGVRTRRLAP
ncbi:MAG: hypothetical protein ABIS86_23440 [Streptosporangiaceae bacterium]